MKASYRDVILTVIAALLAVIACQIWLYRPVTAAELRALDKADNQDARKARIASIPLAIAAEVNGTVRIDGSVEIDGAVDVREIQSTVLVEID